MTNANMTVTHARRPIGSRSGVTTSAVRMGEWVFTPAPVDFVHEANATLHHEDRSIDLQYSSSVLEDFLREMGNIEAEFVSLASAAEASDVHGDQQTGQRFHA